MTQNASNLMPFTPPSTYTSDTWELARRYIAAANVTSMSDLMILSPVGEGKTDTNNKGPLSTDCVGCRCNAHAYSARVGVEAREHSAATSGLLQARGDGKSYGSSTRTTRWGSCGSCSTMTPCLRKYLPPLLSLCVFVTLCHPCSLYVFL